jgi:hypothetical protein
MIIQIEATETKRDEITVLYKRNGNLYKFNPATIQHLIENFEKILSYGNDTQTKIQTF